MKPTWLVDREGPSPPSLFIRTTTPPPQPWLSVPFQLCVDLWPWQVTWPTGHRTINYIYITLILCGSFQTSKRQPRILDTEVTNRKFASWAHLNINTVITTVTVDFLHYQNTLSKSFGFFPIFYHWKRMKTAKVYFPSGFRWFGWILIFRPPSDRLTHKTISLQWKQKRKLKPDYNWSLQKWPWSGKDQWFVSKMMILRQKDHTQLKTNEIWSRLTPLPVSCRHLTPLPVSSWSKSEGFVFFKRWDWINLHFHNNIFTSDSEISLISYRVSIYY